MPDTKEAWRIDIIRRINTEIIPELSRLHESVMSALAETADQLICGIRGSTHMGSFTDLALVNKLILTYHEHLITWTQRATQDFERLADENRSESDIIYDIDRLSAWQKEEFLRILEKCK